MLGTPRSILKQPGSAAKRQKVLFLSPAQEKKENTSLDDILMDDNGEQNHQIENNNLKTSPYCNNEIIGNLNETTPYEKVRCYLNI